MTEWLASNPSDKHGKHRYQLSDFGLTRSRYVRRSLAAAGAAQQSRAG